MRRIILALLLFPALAVAQPSTQGPVTLTYPPNGGLTFTDGVHTVLGSTQLTVAGGTIGGTTPNATLTISASAVSFTPGTTTILGAAAPCFLVNSAGTTSACDTLGTGIATALGVNVGSAGAPVLFNGAGGTPTSITLTNATGLPIAGITGLGTGVGTALANTVNTSTGPLTGGAPDGTTIGLAGGKISTTLTTTVHSASATTANVGGEDDYNGSSLTATLSTLSAGQSLMVTNQNASALSIALNDQTVAGLPLATTLHTGGSYGFTYVSAGVLSGYGFPGFGTITAGALMSFSDASGAATAGNLSGDVTTSGALVTTVAKIAGTTVSGTTGSGNVVFSTSPTLVTPALGTPASGDASNLTNIPVANAKSGSILPAANGGAGTINGALKGNGSGTVSQAASTDLSDSSGLARLGSVGVFTASQRVTVSTPTISTATFTPNFDTGADFIIGLVHASCPCTLANPSTTPVAGQHGVIYVVQSSTGSDTVGTWGSQYLIAGGTSAITLSTAANAIDAFSYSVKDATHIVLSGPVLNVTH